MASIGPTLDDVKTDLSTSLPPILVAALVDAYREIKENFYLAKHEPTELNAGKLCEVAYRILEQEAGGSYTALGTSIKPFDAKCRAFENQTSANDTIRFHIPRILVAVYNIRNKRGVGHIGGDVNPNLADATLVATAADWVMAELLRLHYRCSLDEAQRWVDGLVQRRLALIYEVGGKKRVLNPALSFQQRALVLLGSAFPASVDHRDLHDWTEHSNFTAFKRDVLKSLHKKKLIEYSPPSCSALPTGVKLLEDNYSAWCTYSPSLNASAKGLKGRC